jgi:Flp pilus assembly protein TadD
MFRVPFALLLASLFFIPHGSLHAQGMHSRGGAGGVIDIRVRYANGSGGPRGIHVRLEAAEGGPAGDCITVDGGRCQFNVDARGVYMVLLKEHGFKDQSVRVELVGNSHGFASLDLVPVPGEQTEDNSDTSVAQGPKSVSVLDLSVPENARQEFQKGEDMLKEEKWADGISHLHKALKLYEPFPQAYQLLGSAYVQQQDWTNAKDALEKSIQLDSNSAPAQTELGAVFNQLKDYPQAEKALTRALTITPDAATAHYEITKTYLAEQKWQDAEAHAAKAEAAMPTLAPVHVLMGNILLHKGDAPGALREFQEYLRLAPDGPMAGSARDVSEKIKRAIAKN